MPNPDEADANGALVKLARKVGWVVGAILAVIALSNVVGGWAWGVGRLFHRMDRLETQVSENDKVTNARLGQLAEAMRYPIGARRRDRILVQLTKPALLDSGAAARGGDVP